MPRLNIPVPVPAGMKFCHACQTVKPLAGFNMDRNAKDQLRRYCKPCDVAKATASAAKRKTFAMIAKRMTEPHKVTPAEHAAHANAIAAAFDDMVTANAAFIAVARAKQAKARPAAKVKAGHLPPPDRGGPSCYGYGGR